MSLLNILNSYFTSEDRKKADNEIYVTDLSYCDQYKKFASDFPERLKVVGSIVHYSVEKALIDNGFECEKEVKINYGNYVIKGRIDCYRSDYGIVEIKTSGQFHISHAVQLGFYLWITKIDHGVLLYVNKSNYKEIPIEFRNNRLYIHNDELKIMKFNPKKYINRYIHGDYIHPFNECSFCFFFRMCPYVNNLTEVK